MTPFWASAWLRAFLESVDRFLVKAIEVKLSQGAKPGLGGLLPGKKVTPCIQAQRCHTGHCPTGVATNSKWLERGLDPTDKGLRVGRCIQTMRFELGRMARACGVDHPTQVSAAQLEIINGMTGSRTAHEIFINR